MVSICSERLRLGSGVQDANLAFDFFAHTPEATRGADPDHADARGNTLVAIALAQGNEASVMALRKVGATR
jgi:hypothetical protein